MISSIYLVTKINHEITDFTICFDFSINTSLFRNFFVDIAEVFSPPQVPSSRTRKMTESSEKPGLPPTVFDQRKADHKKKFVEGAPERTRITMFDLIYYNPSDGNRMSNSSSLRSSRAASVDGAAPRRDSEDAVVPNRLESVAERLREEAVDEPDSADEAKNSNDDASDEALPVPQVKVGADGSIILDEASTMIETTAAKKAKEDLLKSPLVFENANQVNVTLMRSSKVLWCTE